MLKKKDDKEFLLIREKLGIKVKIYPDGSVCVLRLSWVDKKVHVEALLESGEWLHIVGGAEYPHILRVSRLAEVSYDPADWQAL